MLIFENVCYTRFCYSSFRCGLCRNTRRKYMFSLHSSFQPFCPTHVFVTHVFVTHVFVTHVFRFFDTCNTRFLKACITHVFKICNTHVFILLYTWYTYVLKVCVKPILITCTTHNMNKLDVCKTCTFIIYTKHVYTYALHTFTKTCLTHQKLEGYTVIAETYVTY